MVVVWLVSVMDLNYTVYGLESIIDLKPFWTEKCIEKSVMIVVFAKNQGWILKSLNNKFLLWVGNISSYTFLIHQVVIRWLQRVLPETLTGNAKIAVVIILSFLISAAGAELVRMLEKNKNWQLQLWVVNWFLTIEGALVNRPAEMRNRFLKPMNLIWIMPA